VAARQGRGGVPRPPPRTTGGATTAGVEPGARGYTPTFAERCQIEAKRKLQESRRQQIRKKQKIGPEWLRGATITTTVDGQTVGQRESRDWPEVQPIRQPTELELEESAALLRLRDRGPEAIPYYAIVPEVPEDGSAAVAAVLQVPPTAQLPGVRLKLKTRVAPMRCRSKTFTPQEFTGVMGTGGRVIHKSHRLAGGRGVVWCWKCGHYAVIRPQKLCRPCPGAPGEKGAMTLARLRKGLPPYSVGKWSARDNSLFRKLRVVDEDSGGTESGSPRQPEQQPETTQDTQRVS
jgi:hypothetical protein